MHLPKSLLLLSTLLPIALPAATLCVNPNGSGGCYTTISAAVAAAAVNDIIDVGPGTYRETVLITKPLSLVGYLATIDATGLSRGIFVNGMATPNLTEVHISGFTVKKANFEGILVANSSDVSISDNTILDNDLSLSNAACPGIEAFETNEQDDCGEGIHLLGSHHSIVTGNSVHDNSGGILISDDTGATHDNLISFNSVHDNSFDCGITLASHPPAAITGSMLPLGVFHNTIYANDSEKNGLNVAGAGAGVGIFASIPGASSYGNVVVNNFLKDNGLPGIAMHAHAPNQNLNDNMLVGNTILGNGADTEDAATPGPTGINLYAFVPATGNIVSGNFIRNETDDVAISTAALVQVEFNNLLGGNTGLDNIGTGSVDATNNWWGCPHGPILGPNCSKITGSDVLSAPWLFAPAPVEPGH
jgi:parallel beta-helix repeat protein